VTGQPPVPSPNQSPVEPPQDEPPQDEPPQDHDQRFKVLLREFVDQFFLLFFPELARRFDFTGVEWLDTEAFPDPPQGPRRMLDLLARLPLVEPVEIGPGVVTEDLVALIHVEIESADSVAPLRRRMFHYFAALRQRFTEPILPVALLLKMALDGIGTEHHEETFGRFEVFRYNFLYVGLAGLNAADYADSEQILAAALSALMRMPADQRARIKADLMERVAGSGETEYWRELLSECIDAYLRLRADEQAEFDQLMETEEDYQESRVMTTTWEQRGIEKGIEKGRRESVIIYASMHFGEPSVEQRERIDAWPADQLEELVKRVFQAQSAEEFDKILRKAD
jgi:hypothetical protein